MSSAATLTREGEHLAALASETVEHLMAHQQVGELPGAQPDWNQAFIGAVREVKDRYRDSPDLPALLRIVSEKLYGIQYLAPQHAFSRHAKAPGPVGQPEYPSGACGAI